MVSLYIHHDSQGSGEQGSVVITYPELIIFNSNIHGWLLIIVVMKPSLMVINQYQPLEISDMYHHDYPLDPSKPS